MEQVTLKLDNFEGPLSLLYHLIEKNKVDIYDIPIFEITKQYMDVIYGSDIKDMEFISGFIVMASTLMEIKSKMLLPRQKNDEGEEIDPREELVNRLVEYKKYREAAEKLREKENLYAVRLFKEPDPVLSIIKSDYKSSVEGFMDGVTFDDIINAFKRVMTVKEMRTDNIKSGFKSVSHDEFTIEEKMKYLKELIYLTPKLKFADVFSKSSTRSEIAVTFLALLELIKTGAVFISQDYNFGDITISKGREVLSI